MRANHGLRRDHCGGTRGWSDPCRTPGSTWAPGAAVGKGDLSECELSEDRQELGQLLLNGIVRNLCPGSVSFALFYSHVNMETPTHPLQSNIVTQTLGDEPTFGTALWAIAGFIIFAAVIFAVVTYAPW